VLWTDFGTDRRDFHEGTLEWVPVDNLASRPM
jgi:hypothetical protein